MADSDDYGVERIDDAPSTSKNVIKKEADGPKQGQEPDEEDYYNETDVEKGAPKKKEADGPQ